MSCACSKLISASPHFSLFSELREYLMNPWKSSLRCLCTDVFMCINIQCMLVRHVSADYIVWPFNKLKSGSLLILLLGLFSHSLVMSVNMSKRYGSTIRPLVKHISSVFPWQWVELYVFSQDHTLFVSKTWNNKCCAINSASGIFIKKVRPLSTSLCFYFHLIIILV